jgi:hypothetical protein
MNTQKWYSCSRTVVLLLFLVSCTEVRSRTPCSSDSDCDYDGCLVGSFQGGWAYCWTYQYYCTGDAYRTCPERLCPAGTFNTDSKVMCSSGGKGRGGGTECTCTRCPSGKYSITTGATVCVDCGAGQYSITTGATVATICVDIQMA